MHEKGTHEVDCSASHRVGRIQGSVGHRGQINAGKGICKNWRVSFYARLMP